MFVVMPIAPAYEEYAMEILKRIATRDYNVCYEDDYATPIHRRVQHFYRCRILIVGKANVEAQTVIMRSPWLNTIETYALTDVLDRLDEFDTHK